MRNDLFTNTDGTPDLLSCTDDGTNTLYVDGSEVPTGSWTGSGDYSFTSGSHTYTIAKAADANGNLQLVKDSDYSYQFQRLQAGGSSHPVGSIAEFNTSVNPATYYGGTWVQIHKNFFWKTLTNSGFTFDSNNCDSTYADQESVILRRSDEIQVRLKWKSAAAYADTSLQIGTIDLSAVGLSSMYAVFGIAYSDDGGGIGMVSVTNEGVVNIVDIVQKTGAASIASGSTWYMNINLMFTNNAKIDSECNDFVWRRSA